MARLEHTEKFLVRSETTEFRSDCGVLVGKYPLIHTLSIRLLGNLSSNASGAGHTCLGNTPKFAHTPFYINKKAAEIATASPHISQDPTK